MKICQNCGTRLPEGAGFCTRCGAPQNMGKGRSVLSYGGPEEEREPRTERLPEENYGNYVYQPRQKAAANTLPLAVWVFAAVNIVFFLIVELTGGSENLQNMVRWGAVYGPRIVDRHEYWRFLAAAFLHFGIAHISNNMLVLFVLGQQLEKVLGHLKFIVLYLFSAVAANVLAFFIQFSEMEYRISAGASGAIFAVSGGLLWAAIRNRGRAGTLAIRQILIFTALSMLYGLTGEDVDNTVHVMGFVVGFLVCMLLYRPKAE